MAEYESVESGVAARSIMILWALWNSRNEFVFQRRHTPAVNTMQRGLVLLYDFCNYHKSEKTLTQARPVRTPSWTPRSARLIKVNVDAAFKNGKAGFGFVLRDENGLLLTAGAGPLHYISSVMQAELMGIWQSFQLVTCQKSGNIIIESDCQALITKLNSTSPDLSELGMVCEGFRELLDAYHFAVQVNFCPRNINQAAHLLAAMGIGFQSDVIWEGYAPPNVLDVIQIDWSL